MKKLLSLFAMFALFGNGALAQQVPTIISYQGYITQNGSPIDGSVNIDLTLYDAQTQGNQKWSHSYSSVSVSKGYYTVQMDFSHDWQNGSVDFHGQFWLDAVVNGQDMGRVQMTGSPFAVNAIRADTAAVALKLVPDAPIGTIVAYAGQAFGIPQEKTLGWYVCDGSLISATDFPQYKNAIGSIYGTNFTGDSAYLPDLRGLFLRGINGGRNDQYADPDASSRVALNGHGLAGNQIGSIQQDEFKQHFHYLNFRKGNSPIGFTRGGDGFFADPPNPADQEFGSPYMGGTTNSGGSNETRPKNAYVYWLIKVR